MEGKVAKMFLGDKEIKGVTSFHIGNIEEEINLSATESITFEGRYDPSEMDVLLELTNDEVVGIIHSPSGETRESRMKVTKCGGEITLEPTEKDIREWVKGWLKGDNGDAGTTEGVGTIFP